MELINKIRIFVLFCSILGGVTTVSIILYIVGLLALDHLTNILLLVVVCAALNVLLICVRAIVWVIKDFVSPNKE